MNGWPIFRTRGGVTVVALEVQVRDERLRAFCRRWRPDGTIGGFHGWLVVSRLEPLSDAARAIMGN